MLNTFIRKDTANSSKGEGMQQNSKINSNRGRMNANEVLKLDFSILALHVNSTFICPRFEFMAATCSPLLLYALATISRTVS